MLRLCFKFIIWSSTCRCCLNYFAIAGIPSSPVRRLYKSFISNLRLILPCVATSLGLTLLPICVSLLRANSWPLQIRKLPCRVWLYLRVEYRLFPLRQLVGLFRCRFGSAWPVQMLQSASPPHAPTILAYLPGFASARPLAFVVDAGFEPTSRWSSEPFIKFCAVAASPLGQSTKYFVVSFRFLFKTSELRSGLVVRSIKLLIG